jgi:hypothetical protein
VNRLPAIACIALFAALLLEPRPASAYLDPSTGSMLISGLVSLVVTAWLALQTYWHKLLRWFRPDRAEGEADVDAAAGGDDRGA